jgi:hypothetical protein
MELVKIAELISLSLTVPTIVLALSVVWIWGPAAIKAWFLDLPSAHSWFILGVATGFTGGIFDNLYWGFPWLYEYLDYPTARYFMEHGVYFNIPFRQGLGIFAAYCHLRAAAEAETLSMRALNQLLALSFTLATALGVSLLILRGMF